MTVRRWALGIVGLVLLFFGVVFALQGANIIGGSSVMSGNSTYIYVGAVVAIVGIIILIAGLRSRSPRTSLSSPTTAGGEPKTSVTRGSLEGTSQGGRSNIVLKTQVSKHFCELSATASVGKQ